MVRIRGKLRRWIKTGLIVILAIQFCTYMAWLLFAILHIDDPASRNLNLRHEFDSCSSMRSSHWKFGLADQRLAEERRIQAVLSAELADILARRDAANAEYEDLRASIAKLQETIYTQQLLLEELKLRQKEYKDLRNVHLSLPGAPLVFKPSFKAVYPPGTEFKTLEDVLDFRACSVSKQFLFYVPPVANILLKAKNVYSMLQNHPSYTSDPILACLQLVLVEKPSDLSFQGINPVFIDLGNVTAGNQTEQLPGIVVASAFTSQRYFDVSLFIPPPILPLAARPLLLPHNRSLLLVFAAPSENSLKINENLNQTLTRLVKSGELSADKIVVDFTVNAHARLYPNSAFVLLFPEFPNFLRDFYNALYAGSIPVIVASSPVRLPFDDVIDWRLATLQIARSRLPEVHFIVRSVFVADLLELRRKGRFYYDHYLGSTEVSIASLITNLRFKLQVPSTPTPAFPAEPLFSNSSFFAPNLTAIIRPNPYDEDVGPMEAPMPSVGFTHNFTAFSLYSSSSWNNYPFMVHNTPRYLLNDVYLPSEAEFFDETSIGMRPILPGSGPEFRKALGGNRPKEQFTIVIVTYNRDAMLYSLLESLNGTAFLNKIIVIWNNLERQPPTAWPRLHAPVYFVKAKHNSLNNRFLPYDLIETEAVLSLDDDMDLTIPEIVFGFRVWREQRNRIVGYIARYHARFGNDMFYNSNHTCQYSMILTGAAFMHRDFLRAYSELPFMAPIRKHVDDQMNCEDIAMNFLVAHLTRLPPIKLTTKWTMKFTRLLPETLSKDDGHFSERHDCIRQFTQHFGYNPLLFSQYRGDSVLFKTRVPAKGNHEKCFKLV